MTFFAKENVQQFTIQNTRALLGTWPCGLGLRPLAILIRAFVLSFLLTSTDDLILLAIIPLAAPAATENIITGSVTNWGESHSFLKLFAQVCIDMYCRVECLLFLKLNQSRNTKKTIVWGFLQKPRRRFFQGKNKIVFNLKFQICIFAFVLYCKRKPHANFHKQILIFEAPGIFWKLKLWRACADACRVHTFRNFGFGLLKSCLTFG